jgi:chromosome segregation ATPase
LNALSTNNPQAIQNKIIDLTKQNSILDLNLLRLSRKYTNLEEQEKMLRREYHAKDSDMAEKDKFVQERINSLKEWKANAMTQL